MVKAVPWWRGGFGFCWKIQALGRFWPVSIRWQTASRETHTLRRKDHMAEPWRGVVICTNNMFIRMKYSRLVMLTLAQLTGSKSKCLSNDLFVPFPKMTSIIQTQPHERSCRSWARESNTLAGFRNYLLTYLYSFLRDSYTSLYISIIFMQYE